MAAADVRLTVDTTPALTCFTEEAPVIHGVESGERQAIHYGFARRQPAEASFPPSIVHPIPVPGAMCSKGWTGPRRSQACRVLSAFSRSLWTSTLNQSDPSLDPYS